MAEAYQCHGSNVGPMGVLRAGNGNEGGGVPFVTAFASKGGAGGAFHEDGVSPTLNAHGQEEGGQPPAIAFALRKDPGGVGQGHNTTFVPDAGVRRLTPRECERLQGLPDEWTKLDDKTPDSRRYSALGDAVTATVAEWIGRRLFRINAKETQQRTGLLQPIYPWAGPGTVALHD